MDSSLIRLMFSKSNIPTVSSILGTTQYGGYTTYSNASYNTSGIFLWPYTLNVSQNGSTVTFSATLHISAELDTERGYTSGIARLKILLYKDGAQYAEMASIGGNLDQLHLYIDETYNINESVIVPSGNYSIAAVCTFLRTTNNEARAYNTPTLSWSLVKDIRRFEFGLDGFMSWYTNAHIHFTETGGFDGRAPLDKWNAPGVLLSGTVSSAGSLSSVWGAKKSTSAPTWNSTGKYTVYHTVGHSDYQVFASSHSASRSYHIVSKANTNFVVEWRTIGSSPTLIDNTFDFQIVGNNY